MTGILRWLFPKAERTYTILLPKYEIDREGNAKLIPEEVSRTITANSREQALEKMLEIESDRRHLVTWSSVRQFQWFSDPSRRDTFEVTLRFADVKPSYKMDHNMNVTRK